MVQIPLKSRVRNYLRGIIVRDVVMAYRHRGLTAEDVILAAYPKCGTTWLMFMIAEVLWRAGTDHSLRDHRYSPNIGSQHLAQHRLVSGGRLIRSHEPYRREYQRAIYISRDPRDAAVSMYWHAKRTQGLRGSFSEFLPTYFSGSLSGAGPWQKYTADWLDSPLFKNGTAILVRYEDMKADPAHELRRALKFVGVDASDQEIARGVGAGRFEVMKAREKTTAGMIHREADGKAIPAIRKGIVGDWQNHFSDDDLRRLAAVFGPTMARIGYQLD